MPSDWQPTSLGEMIEVKHGFAFPGEFIHDECKGDILLTPGNFAIRGGFKGDKFKYYDGPVPAEFVLAEGDLLVTMTDLSKQSDTLGFPAFVPASVGSQRYLHNQRLGKIVIKDASAIDKRYLHYLLCSREYRHEVLASATGTTVRHTSPDRIKRFRFLRPPLEEQRAIGQILGTVDNKIKMNVRMNQTLEAIARVLFKSWFIDFDPVNAKMVGRNPGLPKRVADLFPDSFEDSELGEIPKGWQVVPLYEIATYINGGAYSAFEPNNENRGLPIIKIAELKAGITPQTKFSSVELPEKYRIKSGDILFSWSGNPDTSIDTFVWSNGEAWLNQHIFRVVPHRPEERSFVLVLLKQLRPVFAEIARNKQTTGLGHVTAGDMKRLLVVRPAKRILLEWDAFAAPLLDRVFLNQIGIGSLASLRDALLPKLISGELRVRDERALRFEVGKSNEFEVCFNSSL